MTDISFGEWVMNPQRTQLAKFTPVLSQSNLISIVSLDKKVNPNNSTILTTFQPITWWLLLISLMFISLINIKSTKNFLINYIISLICHYECLLTKQSKF